METTKPSLKFIQITIGQWTNPEGVMFHTKNPVSANTQKPITRTTSHSTQIIDDDDIPF